MFRPDMLVLGLADPLDEEPSVGPARVVAERGDVGLAGHVLVGNGGPGRTRTCNQTVMSGRL